MSDAGRRIDNPQILRGTPPFDGVAAAKDMLRSDIPLSKKWTYEPSHWRPADGGLMATPSRAATDESDIASLRDYVQGLSANKVVPPARDSYPENEAKEDENSTSVSGPSVESKLKDGGVGNEWGKSNKRDLKTGKTTTESRDKVDNDFRGKFQEKEVTIVEGKAEAKASAAVAEGSFGDDDSFASGKGSVLGGEAAAEAKGSVTSKGLKGSAKASAEAYMMKGSVKTREDGFVKGDASGAVMRASAEASGEVILTAEQATASGKLGASANLIEGKMGGEICVTPRRVSNLAISAYNWSVGDDYEGLDENWDIGFCVGGEVGASVGAQAEVDGKIGYEKGKASAEAGAKLGLGAGASAKVKGSIMGFDKLKGFLGL
ncbi:hypothetical protein [Fulvimarina sp. MAC8]|uniref:hypothetical protein n=1 Tax=Fulvimarina sp. MAC8 TaxID=3162874 RepID=UPI0032EBFA61